MAAQTTVKIVYGFGSLLKTHQGLVGLAIRRKENTVRGSLIRLLPARRCFVTQLMASVLIMLLIGLPAQPSRAAALNVMTCAATDLIATINTANAQGGPDTIALMPRCIYTLTASNNTSPDRGPNGLPVISSAITILGNGATIQRSTASAIPRFRIFLIAPGGSLQLEQVTISGGAASGNGPILPGNVPGAGGGLANYGALTLLDTTISGNTAEAGGGGIYIAAVEQQNGSFSAALATLRNTTVSGNVAGSGGGGGIYTFGIVSLSNTTISANTARFAGGLGSDGGVNAWNSILAGNTASEVAPDCVGSINSLGYNLVQNAEGCGFVGNTTGNLVGLDPLLGPLQDNGGTTFTQALLPGSPAIDAGNPAAPGSSETACEATDQRGIVRSQDGNRDGSSQCDIGAYEVESTMMSVDIDIKPGSVINAINLTSKGVIPVAILTSMRFDATTIDPLSVRFGPAEARELHGRGHLEDVDADGDLDLMLHFRTRQAGLQCGMTSASLKGTTTAAQPFSGSDGITLDCR